ncbi:MAG: hypothetical protein LUQ25_06320 [Methanoregulaceae archaeon]|nr:hypothetical protein [Methanoregulaceae archaeon]
MPDTLTVAKRIMLDFAARTGLEPVSERPKRYLWTDAFAVCNLLELHRQTRDTEWRDLTLRLVDQVHTTLGRHREDDSRTGWISGLPDAEGRLHPTRGGLRIGKDLPERKPAEIYDDQLEWDRDGQYYHYLTKWMHALNRVSRVTGDPKFNTWALELANAVHERFVYVPPAGGRKRMYWKMSLDLSRPLVTSMGMHDPLDGLVTYLELSEAAGDFGEPLRRHDLSGQIADMAAMTRGLALATDDPLGTGGLLFDANRVARLMVRGTPGLAEILQDVLEASLLGIKSFAAGGTLTIPAGYRLAFRELGLSIGLLGASDIRDVVTNVPGLPDRAAAEGTCEALVRFIPLGEEIGRFWTDRKNQMTPGWNEHLNINSVMLATHMLPAGFLAI